MSTKLTSEQLAEIREAMSSGDSQLMYVTASSDNMRALLDHCTALEEELKSSQNELSKAARLINCAGPLDHRVQMMKLDYSAQITKLEEENARFKSALESVSGQSETIVNLQEELKAAQDELQEKRCQCGAPLTLPVRDRLSPGQFRYTAPRLYMQISGLRFEF